MGKDLVCLGDDWSPNGVVAALAGVRELCRALERALLRRRSLIMLRITIEMCPSGDVDTAVPIAVGVIGRVEGPDHHGESIYVVTLTEDGQRVGDATVAHDPARGPWRLTADAIVMALSRGGYVSGRHRDDLDAAVARAAGGAR
jgi:hypothetical protein